MKRILILFILIFSISQVKAGLMDPPGSPALQKGDIIIGGKLALGAVYGANVGFVVSGEYGIKEGFLNIPNFPASLGAGLTLGYSGYSENYAGWGKYSYSNYLILGSAYWHVHLIKKKEFDTYVVLNLGLNIDTQSTDVKNGPDFDSGEGGVVFGTGVGIKYYFIPQLAAVAEAGFGMGVIRIGLDFRI